MAPLLNPIEIKQTAVLLLVWIHLLLGSSTHGSKDTIDQHAVSTMARAWALSNNASTLWLLDRIHKNYGATFCPF